VQWLVTEQANGGSLETWLSAWGVLTLAELVDLLRSVMRALVYLHSRTPAVIHRDVKPANVLVFTSPHGVTWKLADVGIAKVLQSTLRAITLAGTPMYTADILLGPYDGRVDVFSTGIVAAELVVRHMDIAGFERVAATQYSLPEHRAALVEGACARLDSVCPSLSSVVRRCCAVMPSDRMHSDAALLALSEIDVGRGGGGGGGTLSAAAIAPSMPRGGTVVSSAPSPQVASASTSASTSASSTAIAPRSDAAVVSGRLALSVGTLCCV
jgi:serine/threonine protein kinase